MEKTQNLRKYVLIVLFLFMAIYRSLFFFGLRGVDCASNWLTPIASCQWYNAFFEILLWLIVLILFILQFRWNHDFTDFFAACRRIWPVFGFVLLAAISMAWSILFTITLYKVFVLLMSTLMAIYVGYQLGIAQLLNVLVWFFGAICVASLTFVLIFPQYGIMADDFYHQAWNGLFWHRNYLGCFMALGIMLFLLKLLDWRNLGLPSKGTIPVMMALAVFLLVKGKSATGIITALVLVVLCLLAYAWVRWGSRLKPIHYYFIAGGIVLVVVLLLTQLDFLFGLLGRSTSLTGRVPMWQYLFQNVISYRPWLGYGYSAIWNLAGFRTQLGTILNWNVQVLIGDNGFIDIWLHLGIVGVVLLAGLILAGFIRAISYFLREKTLVSFLPFLILVFLTVANISLSLILESETLVWSLAIASQVAIGSVSKRT